MSIMDLFLNKEKKHQDNCPTNVLLYISTIRQSRVPVNPWYDTIKGYVGGANWHYPEFHQACVFGMFPELEKPANFFDTILETRITALKEAYEAKNEKVPQAMLDKTLEGAEKDTITQFHLPDTYFIGKLTGKQKQRIKQNIKPLMVRYVERGIQAYSPAIQVLAQATKSALPQNQPLDLEFLKYFDWINSCLKNPDRYEEFKSDVPQNIYPIVDSLLDLKQQGVINNKLQITNYDAFKESSLVTNFSYQKKSLNLKSHLMPKEKLSSLKTVHSLEL